MRNLAKAAAAILALLTALNASAAQFHLPLHLPPHRCEPADASGKEFLIGLGYAAAAAPGISISGPGGYWERAALGKNKVGFSARGYGYAFSGKVDPFRIGHETGGGMAGGFELDLLLAPRGKESYRLYGGFLAGLSSLDVRSPLDFNLVGGSLKTEPDNAFSLFIGFPVGVLAPVGISESWRAELQGDLVFFPSGITLFSYAGIAAPVFGSTKRIRPDLSGGGRAGLLYIPWNLSIEALARRTAGLGDNELMSFWALQAALKLF